MKSMHFALALSLTTGLVMVALSAQSARRVTLVTQKGDVIEGTLKSATDADVVIEVAGQPLRVSLETIRYMSFVGKLDAAPPMGTDSGKPLEVALKALKELRGASRVGMLREQYSEKLVATLPQVRAFAEGPGDSWADVKIAMMFAVARYEAPMASLEMWTNAGFNMTVAGNYVDYVEALMALKDEETHTEKPSDQAISIGSDVTGRLGKGDVIMAKTVEKSAAGGFGDNWTLDMKTPSQVTIELTSKPCHPYLVLTDESGKKLDSDAGGSLSGQARIRKSLPAGRYHIWAGSSVSEVGTYKLAIRPQ